MNDMRRFLEGRAVAPEDLHIPKARDVAHALRSGRMNWVRLVGCHRHDPEGQDDDTRPARWESVVLEVEVELPQRLIHDIRRFERIQVLFETTDTFAPQAFALREDFPLVPHTNLNWFEYPRSLCLTDKPYSELKLSWTAPAFIESVRTWLAKTATNTLHAPDQPLEPLLWGATASIILPSELFGRGGDENFERLSLRRQHSGDGTFTFVARRSEEVARLEDNRQGDPMIALRIMGEPQQHGIIRNKPNSLLDLHGLLQAARVDLLGLVRERLKGWQSDKEMLRASLMIVAHLPKTRNADGDSETIETRIFLCTSTADKSVEDDDPFAFRREVKPISLLEIGEQVGLWEIRDGEAGILIFPDATKQGEQVGTELLNESFALTREFAALYNGLSPHVGKRITAIGMGALGSQLFLNLVRAGFGQWTIIDNDRLLPHNLARHALFGAVVGMTKVEALAYFANTTIDGDPIATPIFADILNPGRAAAQVSEGLTAADVICDFSASVPVARHLAQDVDSSARRVSAFLNPSGSDLVMLVEDAERRINLAALEMQYYRFLIHEPALHEHLRASDGRMRYAHSCRDLSSTIPQDYVALHAATASHALRRALATGSPGVSVWQADEDGSVRQWNVEPAAVSRHEFGEWTLYTDERLLDKVRQARAERLPSETGGVLLGSFDTQRKIVYVVDTLPSPPDSVEEPKGYTRGYEGLLEQITEVERITLGNLRYVGEWHSHPAGYSCTPSSQDHEVFDWLAGKMGFDGLPPLMLIAGDGDQQEWRLNSLPPPTSPGKVIVVVVER